MSKCVICGTEFTPNRRSLTCPSPSCRKRLRIKRDKGVTIEGHQKLHVIRRVKSLDTCAGVYVYNKVGVLCAVTLCGRYMSAHRRSRYPHVNCEVCRSELNRLYGGTL